MLFRRWSLPTRALRSIRTSSRLLLSQRRCLPQKRLRVRVTTRDLNSCLNESFLPPLCHDSDSTRSAFFKPTEPQKNHFPRFRSQRPTAARIPIVPRRQPRLRNWPGDGIVLGTELSRTRWLSTQEDWVKGEEHGKWYVLTSNNSV